MTQDQEALIERIFREWNAEDTGYCVPIYPRLIQNIARAQQAQPAPPPPEESHPVTTPDMVPPEARGDLDPGPPEEPEGEPWALLLDLLRASGDIVLDRASGSTVLAKGPTWLEAAKAAHKAIMKRDAALAAKKKRDG